MSKNTIITKHFQKLDQLTMNNNVYLRCVDHLCEWLLRNDNVQKDLTTRLLFSRIAKPTSARIFTKQDMTVAGIEEVAYLIETFTEIQIVIKAKDGTQVKKGQTLIKLKGTSLEILAYERTILNILQHLSGIATGTAAIVSNVAALQVSHVPMIAATRKTQWTLLDKKAVALGGGATHRLTLSDGVLVKDNHLLLLQEQQSLQSELELAVKTFEMLNGKIDDMLIEIEVEKKESVEALVKAAINAKSKNTLCIMFDNFTAGDAKKVIASLKKKYDLSYIVFEASGGITKDNIREWAKTGVDIISLGALTHSPQAVDISLEITE